MVLLVVMVVVAVVVVVVLVVFIFNKSSSQHNVISTVNRLQGGQCMFVNLGRGNRFIFSAKCPV